MGVSFDAVIQDLLEFTVFDKPIEDVLDLLSSEIKKRTGLTAVQGRRMMAGMPKADLLILSPKGYQIGHITVVYIGGGKYTMYKFAASTKIEELHKQLVTAVRKPGLFLTAG